MRNAQVRTIWTGGMLVVAGICLAIMVAAMLGCGAVELDAPEPGPSVDVAAPASVELDDGIQTEFTAEERAETEEFMRQFKPTGAELFFDDAALGGAVTLPKGQTVEKDAGYVALTGWAFAANLAFQDGTRASGEPWLEGDHCSLFGLSCDDEWHAQIRQLLFDGSTSQFAREFRGGCGSSVLDSRGQSNFWLPCANVYLTESDREITWFFDQSSCPNSSRGRRIIRNGIRAMADSWSRYNFVDMREVDNVTEFPEVYYYCDRTMSPDTAASWQPSGNFSLRYGSLKLPGDIAAITYEQCETPGLPGSRGGKNYAQALDFMYSYDQAYVRLNWDAVFTKMAECTTNESELTRGWRNIVYHENGHHVGFHHEQYDHADYGIMAGGSMPCEMITEYSMGFDDLHRSALLGMDMSPNDGDLIIWDEDISCYKPSEF